MQRIAVCRINPNGVNTYFQDVSSNQIGKKIYFRGGTKRFTSFRESRLVPPESYEMAYEDDKFNERQWSIFKLVMFGLGTIPRMERDRMSGPQLKRARVRYLKAQTELNRMKNEFMESQVKFCVGSRHDTTGFTELCCIEYDSVRNSLPFALFKITEEMIVRRLISAGILRQSDFPTLLSPGQVPVSQQVPVVSQVKRIEALQH